MDRPNYYAWLGPGSGFDRAAERRRDAAWLAGRLSDPRARFVPVWRSRNLVAEGPAPAPALLTRAEIDGLAGLEVFLGEDETGVYFAIEISDAGEDDARALAGGRGTFIDLRSVGGLMDRRGGSLLAYARGLAHWHARHRFCGACGAPTRPESAGHVRVCTDAACATHHFPRTDPAVIMLIADGDRCLLGRGPRIPKGMHSTLAGFVEPGESLEDAVRREVLEETGIRVGAVRYHSSQPWPFPGSIMLGFHGMALSRDIAVNPDELETAGWFSRDFLRRSHDPETFRLPRADSIARRLIEDWLAAG